MEEMRKEIANSKLSPGQKLFLVSEWVIRDYLPNELQNVELSDIHAKVKSYVARHFLPGFRESALEELKSVFHVENHERISSLIIGLAYYSYIESEFVYEHEMRFEMMSRVSELGFELSEIEQFYEKWVDTFGSSEDLFNRVFEK
jgi:hypothetical protein